MKPRLSTASALLLTSLLSLSVFAQGRLVPNSVKYSDTGIPKATGRSGNAAVEAQALQFPGGLTSVMLTTGSIDDPYSTGSGTIATVQFKHGDAVENLRNDSPTSWYRMNRTDLVRHEPLQYQLHVRGIDNREDIVTVDDVVKLAPDVMIESLDAPATAPAGVPVNISATLHERNGDIGARVGCVLLVNSVDQDVVEHVWVDAGGTVTCSMNYAFPAPGTMRFSVQVFPEAPQDYDYSNNYAEASIEIAKPTAPAGEFGQWKSTARFENFDYRSVTQNFSGLGQEQHNTGWRTSSRFDGTINAGVDVNNIGVAYAESTEGRVIVARDATQRLLISPLRPDGSQCGIYQSGRFLNGSVCSNGSVTTLTFQRTASQAVYLSRAWFRSTDADGNEQFDEWYYIEMDQVSGTRVPYGSTVEMDFTIYAGTRWWDVSPFMTMNPFEDRNTHTSTCTDTYCRTMDDRVWGTSGTDTND
jgi:hypothetical protein